MRLFLFALALMFVTPLPAKAQDQATVVASCGSVTLTAGTQHFRTIDTNGVTCSSGGGTPPTSVWSSSDATAGGMTLSNGGLTVVAGPGGYQTIRGTIGHATGKYYVEFKTSVAVTGNMLWGIGSSGIVLNDYLGTSDYSLGACIASVGTFASPASNFTINRIIAATPAANDVWAMAVDLTAGKIWIAQNNVWNTLFDADTRDPASGTLPLATFTPPALGQAYFPAMSLQIGGSSTGVWTLQPTAASQKYAPPSGFKAWDAP